MAIMELHRRRGPDVACGAITLAHSPEGLLIIRLMDWPDTSGRPLVTLTINRDELDAINEAAQALAEATVEEVRTGWREDPSAPSLPAGFHDTDPDGLG